MPKAYVLVNVDAGSDKEVFQILKKIDGITQSHIILGAADIIVEIDNPSSDFIHQIIYEKIRKIDQVRSTQTLTVVE